MPPDGTEDASKLGQGSICDGHTPYHCSGIVYRMARFWRWHGWTMQTDIILKFAPILPSHQWNKPEEIAMTRPWTLGALPHYFHEPLTAILYGSLATIWL